MQYYLYLTDLQIYEIIYNCKAIYYNFIKWLIISHSPAGQDEKQYVVLFRLAVSFDCRSSLRNTPPLRCGRAGKPRQAQGERVFRRLRRKEQETEYKQITADNGLTNQLNNHKKINAFFFASAIQMHYICTTKYNSYIAWKQLLTENKRLSGLIPI